MDRRQRSLLALRRCWPGFCHIRRDCAGQAPSCDGSGRRTPDVRAALPSPGIWPTPPDVKYARMSDLNRLVLVGRVAGAFGVKGEVRIRAYTAEPLALLDY